MKKQTLDLAIVTCCHNYGKYLQDWAESIVAQDRFSPTVCAIVDNGSTDNSPRQIEEAAAIIRAAGIPCVTERMRYSNMGAARNRAVSLSGETEWVMHLDADDRLMEHALADTSQLMPNADVIGFGYQRSGDLAAGPRNRTRLYGAHQGEGTLKSTAPCSGVSPFRRKFWKHTPYRTDMKGGWDTALWLGFAHQRARFVPTGRPVFFYRQHADSVFNQRRISDRKGKLVGRKLRNIRAGITDGVSVVVPVMPDGGYRDETWQWVRRQYERNHPSWEVVEGRLDPGSVWCKGAAVAQGLEKASHHTLIVADSDCFLEPHALAEAVARLQDEDINWIVPHNLVHRFDRATTDRILQGEDPTNEALNPTYDRAPYTGYAGGGLLVVDRSDYEAVGGIPRAFTGWGAEDECLAVVLNTVVGSCTRFENDLVHLWHPSARKANVHRNKDNRDLLRIFLSYQDSPDLMWELAQHVAAQQDPRQFDGGVGSKSILMQAVETHQRGKEVVQAKEFFRVTADEARRYMARPRKLAYPVNSSVAAVSFHPGR